MAADTPRNASHESGDAGIPAGSPQPPAQSESPSLGSPSACTTCNGEERKWRIERDAEGMPVRLWWVECPDCQDLSSKSL